MTMTKISTAVGPGSLAYSGPEAPFLDHHFPSMDIYSFGVSLIEMIVCQPPTTAEKRSGHLTSNNCSSTW